MPAAASDPLPSAAARDVLLLRAHEADGETALWTDDDARWATRVARESPAATSPAGFLAERARAALQRLGPREPRIAALLRADEKVGAGAIVIAAALLGAISGLAIDQIGAAQRINLLAPPVWAVVAWNLGAALVFVLSFFGRGGEAFAPLKRALRALLARTTGWPRPRGDSAPLNRFASDWAAARMPLLTARTSLALHVAAVALALGLTAGLYLRGLVLDYRVGWQSTFLDAPTVQSLLDAALAPASRVSGIAVPALASDAAAPWIHLYAMTLLLAVVLPRGGLALWAAWRARRHARELVLPLQEPYFQRLLLARESRAARVFVMSPVAPSAEAAWRLRDALASRFGPELELRLADERGSDAVAAGCSALVALVDLASTPEAETHGRWLDSLNSPDALDSSAAPTALRPPLLLVVDTAAFRRRFAALPERIAERQALWQRFAAERRLDCLLVDLDRS